jgi:hypothetical protein
MELFPVTAIPPPDTVIPAENVCRAVIVFATSVWTALALNFVAISAKLALTSALRATVEALKVFGIEMLDVMPPCAVYAPSIFMRHAIIHQDMSGLFADIFCVEVSRDYPAKVLLYGMLRARKARHQTPGDDSYTDWADR